MAESQPKRYEFSFTGGAYNSYFFTTVDDLIYELRFVPSTDFFQTDEVLNAVIFEMIISVVDSPKGTRLPADPRVSTTIFTIFEHFFLPNKHAIVFICDSSDGREQARFRKFGQWFYQHTRRVAASDVAKFDLPLLDGDATVYLSLIVSRQHPQMRLIIDLFLQLGDASK